MRFCSDVINCSSKGSSKISSESYPLGTCKVSLKLKSKKYRFCVLTGCHQHHIVKTQRVDYVLVQAPDS